MEIYRRTSKCDYQSVRSDHLMCFSPEKNVSTFPDLDSTLMNAFKRSWPSFKLKSQANHRLRLSADQGWEVWRNWLMRKSWYPMRIFHIFLNLQVTTVSGYHGLLNAFFSLSSRGSSKQSSLWNIEWTLCRLHARTFPSLRRLHHRYSTDQPSLLPEGSFVFACLLEIVWWMSRFLVFIVRLSSTSDAYAWCAHPDCHLVSHFCLIFSIFALPFLSQCCWWSE